MTTILFVDDEPHIVDGLKRTLRSMRHEWRMVFAHSGAEALLFMAQQSFDVIVTDMQMPGMSGAQLLTEVRKQYPHIVRIMLSGLSNSQTVTESLGLTHQFLFKPCEVALLKEAIANISILPHLLESSISRNSV